MIDRPFDFLNDLKEKGKNVRIKLKNDSVIFAKIIAFDLNINLVAIEKSEDDKLIFIKGDNVVLVEEEC